MRRNGKAGLPALLGTILIFDAKTGAPVGLLDGSHITGIRTGAAGAIGAKLLARKHAKNLLIVGAGHVATFQAAATLLSFPGIEKVMVYDGLDYDNADRFVKNLRGTLAKRLWHRGCKSRIYRGKRHCRGDRHK